MVYRIYVEKKPGLANEAAALCAEISQLLGIKGVERVRLVNRYDVEGIGRELFEYAVKTVFSEPQLDLASETLTRAENSAVFAVEYLPGQFDMRADSAAQCVQIISQGERPAVKTAWVYVIYGDLSETELEKIKKHVINPVECREASMRLPEKLAVEYGTAGEVSALMGFAELDEAELSGFITDYGLAMDADDLRMCRDYFRSEGREPTMTEIRMIDTYWSDHCRHTTFLTEIGKVSFADTRLQAAYERYLQTRRSLGRDAPVSLMDIATLAAKYLKVEGELTKLDESPEVNACTVKIKVDVDGALEDWLLLFKNETHNHPTEIEPFGGAATCIGGAIRDPLSGRAYVYAAMRVTGAGDPRAPVDQTLPGKLPQRTIVTKAAAGYSSYGNQIGLATGQVDELYHPGYVAKRMEIGAVIGAAPAENVRRETPAPGDVVILLGGRTGRDGCGGATGSSKSHTLSSLESCGAEVQKGNAPEERKIQRLFRNPRAARLIKRCNDFGAGGVSVAVGELAEGLRIDLNAVPKKYEGLNGTELAISESQERMAVVVAATDAELFMELADSENLEATKIATVQETPRLVMTWNGKNVVDVSREFLDTNGAPKRMEVAPAAPRGFKRDVPKSFTDGYLNLAGDLNVCSKRGLSERFDSTIGAGTVLMPFGGKNQLTPIQAMVNKIPVEGKHTDSCSVMAWGYNPFISEKSPYHGAYLAVVESVSKLIASGADFNDVYLSFQEYFEKPGHSPERWGKPFSALLGAFDAQMDYRVAAIGGKDSMSGSFEDIDVPPTLVSFAVTTARTGDIISPEFKAAGSQARWLRPRCDEDGMPAPESEKAVFDTVTRLAREGKIAAAYTVGYGGAAEAVMKMCFGNMLGFKYEDGLELEELFGYAYGSFIIETRGEVTHGIKLGETIQAPVITRGGETLKLSELLEGYEGALESVYPTDSGQGEAKLPAFDYKVESWQAPAIKTHEPLALIPVFPGTNCEYDSARELLDAGARPEIVVIKNLTAAAIAESVEYFARRLKDAQIVFIPGGFSGGDEPEGSGKFITAFFRNGAVKEQVNELLRRDGLICGICNGFQALIKLGLVPYGEIIDADEKSPTLTFNTIGRHQSRIVRTRVASNKSPWLMQTQPGEIYTVPISHGEGRLVASEAEILRLAENGQIAAQYVDFDGEPTTDIRFNPNNSAYAIEAVTSPDGRVLGKMAHSERVGAGLYKNVDGLYDMGLFRSAVKYFR